LHLPFFKKAPGFSCHHSPALKRRGVSVNTVSFQLRECILNLERIFQKIIIFLTYVSKLTNRQNRGRSLLYKFCFYAVYVREYFMPCAARIDVSVLFIIWLVEVPSRKIVGDASDKNHFLDRSGKVLS